MKLKMKSVLITGILLIFLGWGVKVTGSAVWGGPGEFDDFAQCITDSGAKMFGAYWCPHCANQKQEFGKSWKLIDYVECSLPNRAGQTSACAEAGITSYPTWEFGDGSRAVGELSFEDLSIKTSCPLTETNVA